MADLKAFAEQLVNLTVKEVNELAEILKNEYGIEPAAAAVAVAAGPAAAGAAAEEKTNFDVVLKAAGASKLAVVKLVKELTGLGLNRLRELGHRSARLDTQTYSWVAIKVYHEFGFRPVMHGEDERRGWRIVSEKTGIDFLKND